MMGCGRGASSATKKTARFATEGENVMAVNWPPPEGSYPTWPPPELETDWFSCSNLHVLVESLLEHGFTQDAPTPQERNLFFRNAQCDDGHNVIGRMLVSPDGTRRYPFAVCNSPIDRELLVLWPPYTAGWGSGIE